MCCLLVLSSGHFRHSGYQLWGRDLLASLRGQLSLPVNCHSPKTQPHCEVYALTKSVAAAVAALFAVVAVPELAPS